MSAAARVLRLRELVFAVALIGVVAGLVSMHHVLVSGAGAAMSDTPAAALVVHDPVVAIGGAPDMAEPEPGQGHGGHGRSAHDLLHLCLAVLVGGVAIALALFTLRRSGVTSVPKARPAFLATGSRAPPLPVPRRLALLCVLRT